MRFLAILGIFLFSYSIEAKTLSVDISAPCAILINAEEGTILFEKNARQIAHPASTTKIATALYALERKGNALEEMITAQEEALAVVSSVARKADFDRYPPYRLETGGTHMSLKVGERLSLKVLLYGLMLNSANDAANVIAHHVGGTIPRFMEDLNLYLKKIGMADTHFSNPSGLTHPEHYTTAADMAKLAQVAMKNPVFREIVKTTRYIRPQTNKQPASVLVQHNKLIKPGPLYYPHATGLKTGYTIAAGHNLVASAEKHGRSLIAVVLGAKESVKRFQDAISLFEAAFQEKRVTRTLFSQQYDRFTSSIKGGDSPLEAFLAEDFKVTYYPSEEPEFQAFLHWHSVKLPIAKGQFVGEIQLKTAEGKIWKTAPLFASHSVEATWWTQCCGVASGLLRKQVLIVALMLLTTAAAIYYYLKRREQTAE